MIIRVGNKLILFFFTYFIEGLYNYLNTPVTKSKKKKISVLYKVQQKYHLDYINKMAAINKYR